MTSFSQSAPEVHFGITDIQTVTFPLSATIFKSEEDRRFFVSATDGRTTRDTALAQIDGQSVRWNELLNEFTLGPTAQLILRIFENHRLRPNKCLAIFVLSYDSLRSSQNTFTLQNVNPMSSSVNMKISFSVSFKTVNANDSAQQGQLKDLSVDSPVVRGISENTFPTSSSSIDDKVEASRSVQKAEGALRKIETPQRLVVGVTSTADNIDQALKTTEAVIPSVQSFLEKWNTVAKQVGFVVSAVDAVAEIHPYAKVVWSVISFIPKRIAKQNQLDKDVMNLLDEIQHALHLAPDNELLDTAELRSSCEQSGNRKKTIKQLIDLITTCGSFIQSYAGDLSFWKRLTKNLLGNKADDIANFRQQLKRLHDAFIDETLVDIDANVLYIIQQVEFISERLEEHDLDQKFPFVRGTRFNPEKGCLKGTRIKFLKAITDWVDDVDSPKALMLFGQAGTGKSSIAHEIAKRFDAMGRLTASYCFIRGVTSRDPYRLFTTLARSLCSICPAFKAALDTIIREKPDLLAATDYTTLFKSLIVDPLEGLQSVSPVLIVIDALDESEETNCSSLHSFLGKHLDQLPSNFRILMTSRRESDIMDSFPSSSYVRRMFMDDPQFAHPDEVDNDIYTYTWTKLCQANIDDKILHQLAQKAERLFQWAFVACSYIAKPPPGLEREDCIEKVLHPSGGKESLDALYMTVLERFNMDNPDIGNNFRSIMGQVLGVFEPLSITALNTIRQCSPDKSSRSNVSSVVKHMGSLLSNVASDSECPISPLHTSFRDFLTNPDRSGKFCVNLRAARGQLAFATVQTMNERLHFNMCELKTSYCLNTEVRDLEERIAKHIPFVLSYSCRFWANHLAYAEFEANLFGSLQTFMEEKLLFWLEVLSVRKEVPIASTALMVLSGWLGQRRDDIPTDGMDGLDALAKDAGAFVRYFGYLIGQSAPHIYISALPFTPLSSVIAKLYLPRFPRTFRVERGRLTQWPALEISVPLRRQGVTCVAWSGDNERIAASTDNGDLFILNASTGTTVTGPFNVGDGVSSMAFSHDGLYIASGLLGGGIRIWEAMTGKEVVGKGNLGALKKDREPVSALSFSQDCKQLISGSADGTVLVWKIEEGKVLARPFDGHKYPVWAVSFMGDQEYIVSRSGNRTVRAWNVKTGEKVTKPFEAKDMSISTGTIDTARVGYSSSGYYSFHAPVESSFTVCSWMEAAEGEELMQPDRYSEATHSTPISAFSPDGRFVATCSASQIRIWHANGRLAGKLASGPFSNHRVMCLVFSADGERIMSGSGDGTVRTWNIGIADGAESESAKREVPYSVAFIDGEQIVVGWQGGRVQVLDTSTGLEVMEIRTRVGYGWPLVAVSQNGDLIACTLWDEMHVCTRAGVAVAGPLINDRDSPLSSDRDITAVAFSPTSHHLVACTSRGILSLWNARTGDLIARTEDLIERIEDLLMVARSEDAGVAFLLSCSGDNPTARIAVGAGRDVFIWDTLAKEVAGPFSYHKTDVKALVISANGKYMISASTDCLCVWNSADRMEWGRVTWSRNKIRGPSTLTQNGRRVAFVGRNNAILVYDSELFEGDTLAPLTLAGHLDVVMNMAFSSSGQLLASTSMDDTIRIWNIHGAAVRSQAFINSPPNNLDTVINWDIDEHGWLTCNYGPPLRLIWIPELHRKLLRRPSNVCVVDQRGTVATHLDLEFYHAHGREWTKCYIGD